MLKLRLAVSQFVHKQWKASPVRSAARAARTPPSIAIMAQALQAPPHKVVVKSLPGESTMTIALLIGSKQRNLDRPKDELLEKPLVRIQKTAAPGDKRQKRAKGDAAEPGSSGAEGVAVALHGGPDLSHPPLDPGAVTNETAWQQGRLLRVGEVTYTVEVNPPIVDRLDLFSATTFVGIPLVPLLQTHFAELPCCQWQWYRKPSGKGGAWQPIPGASHRRYTPVPEDTGCLLRVECTPGRQHADPAATAGGDGTAAARAAGSDGGSAVVLGEPACAEISRPVAPWPGPLGAAPRLAQTQEPAASPELRVVSYNILADQYASTDTAKNQIFGHCPPQYLNPDYRRPLVLAELLGFQPDLACLQEVDDRMFSGYLQPQLEQAGYQGLYTNKAGKVREGSATFWRRGRYTLAAHRSLALKELFPANPERPGIAKYGPVFEPMLRSSPELAYALQRIATVAQLTLLLPTCAASDAAPARGSGGAAADQPLLVVNTHLFFHYMAPHIRTMHTWAIMQEAHAFAEAASRDDPAVAAALGGRRPALIFCGDLNSDLNDGIPGAVELLGKGRLGAEFWDWAFGLPFRWGMSNEEGEAAPAVGQQHQVAAAAPPAAAAAQAAPAPGAERGGGGDGNGTGEFGEVSKMVHGAVEHRHAASASPQHSPRAVQQAQQQASQQQEEQGQQRQQGQQGPRVEEGAGMVVAGVDLDIPFRLAPAGRLRGEVTNYVKGYSGLLDYIWYDCDALEEVREVAVPPPSALGDFLPNQRFPSDHLPLVYDLRFRSPAPAGGAPTAAAQGAGGSSQQQGHGGEEGQGQSFSAAGGGGAAGSGGGDARGGAAGGNVLPAAFYNVPVAVDAVAAGRVIAVHTDTIYGLAACATSAEGVAAIYATKQRGDHKPLAICVADVADVPRYGDCSGLPPGLLEALLPGPCTLLLCRAPGAPLTAELALDSVGVRIPDTPFLRAVCRQHRGALALTSANVSGHPSSLSVREFEPLWPACAAVFDGGELQAGRSGSTIIDLTRPGQFAIVREGEALADYLALLQQRFGLARRPLRPAPQAS